jgi:hypothetical protein
MALRNGTVFQFVEEGMLLFATLNPYTSEGFFVVGTEPGTVVKRYPLTYEGIVRVIQDRWVVRNQYPYRPDSWEGIVNALKDSGSTYLRPQGYQNSIQSVIELIEDKFGTPGVQVKGRYPLTFEGIVRAILSTRTVSYENTPYYPTYEGIIRVIWDS